MQKKWTCGKAYIMDLHVRKRVEVDLEQSRLLLRALPVGGLHIRDFLHLLSTV